MGLSENNSDRSPFPNTTCDETVDDDDDEEAIDMDEYEESGLLDVDDDVSTLILFFFCFNSSDILSLLPFS